MKSFSRLIISSAFVITALPLVASAATCASLTTDLGSGSNDKTSAGQVTKLQVYLKEAGYLTATPNGNFGPATYAAVRAFQLENGVSATGFVGPATRAAIKTRSCPVASQPTTQPSTQPSGSFSSPAEGATLATGSTVRVTWTGPANLRSLVLEDEEGIAQGFVTSSGFGGSYAWEVGSVYSSATQRQEVIDEGRYRLRATDESKGRQATDIVSGYFTIAARHMSISSVLPTTVANDDRASFVLYGEGFTESAIVFLNGREYERLRVKYVSDDGRIMVLSAPDRISAGVYSISLKSGKSVYSGGQEITIVSR